MRWFALSFGGLLGVAGLALAWLATRPPAGAYLEPATRYGPTEAAARTAKALAGQQAEPFALTKTGGGDASLSGLLREGPVVLVFINHRCPCSMEAEPVFRAFARAWSGRAVFAGIIDAAGEEARLYAESNLVGYKLLEDPAMSTAAAYGAERSLHVALIGADGRIVQAWPGYSKGMLRELNERLAKETGTAPRRIDVALAPDPITAGCVLTPAGEAAP
jgi:peroxiredoxin